MDRFEGLRSRGRKWFTAFVTLGDPQSLANQARIYLECGVDVLEVGVPHAHPFMDGPLVAESMARALHCGVTHEVARALLASLRREFQHAPIVAMGYADLLPVVHDHRGRSLADAILQIGSRPGTGNNSDIARIGFISSRTGPEEIENARSSTGYIMLQANHGKTGVRTSLPGDYAQKIQRVRRSGIQTPVLLGMGISTPRDAAMAVRLGADGVVIGSACLQAAQAGETPLREFLLRVRTALDSPQQFLR
jgi:tryptophan synthase alpha chain